MTGPTLYDVHYNDVRQEDDNAAVGHAPYGPYAIDARAPDPVRQSEADGIGHAPGHRVSSFDRVLNFNPQRPIEGFPSAMASTLRQSGIKVRMPAPQATRPRGEQRRWRERENDDRVQATSYGTYLDVLLGRNKAGAR